jgi:hypothetical protein
MDNVVETIKSDYVETNKSRLWNLFRMNFREKNAAGQQSMKLGSNFTNYPELIQQIKGLGIEVYVDDDQFTHFDWHHAFDD